MLSSFSRVVYLAKRQSSRTVFRGSEQASKLTLLSLQYLSFILSFYYFLTVSLQGVRSWQHSDQVRDLSDMFFLIIYICFFLFSIEIDSYCSLHLPDFPYLILSFFYLILLSYYISPRIHDLLFDSTTKMVPFWI